MSLNISKTSGLFENIDPPKKVYYYYSIKMSGPNGYFQPNNKKIDIIKIVIT